jgi:nucleoside-diphosphate-sugar epimerase
MEEKANGKTSGAAEKIFKDAQNRTFLVTGASGFIGKAAVAFLLNEGAKVVAADFRVAPQLQAIKSDRLTIWQVDLTGDYKELPSGVTDVIHAAGRVSDWGKYEDFYKINVGATSKLMKLAKDSGVKNFLFISSIDIHGFFGHVEETEDGVYYPSKCFYPRTKTIAEKEVRAYNSPQMKTVCIRPCTVYGPGDTTVQGPIMDAILKGQMGFIDKGKKLISRIYITDLVEGLCRALEFGRGGEAYNIVSGEKITWLEWVDEISKALGVKTPKTSAPYFIAITIAAALEGLFKLFRSKNPPILTKMRIQHAGHDFYFVPTKAKAELGFAPKVAWRDGVKLMAAEYLARKAKKPE